MWVLGGKRNEGIDPSDCQPVTSVRKGARVIHKIGGFTLQHGTSVGEFFCYGHLRRHRTDASTPCSLAGSATGDQPAPRSARGALGVHRSPCFGCMEQDYQSTESARIGEMARGVRRRSARGMGAQSTRGRAAPRPELSSLSESVVSSRTNSTGQSGGLDRPIFASRFDHAVESLACRRRRNAGYERFDFRGK